MFRITIKLKDGTMKGVLATSFYTENYFLYYTDTNNEQNFIFIGKIEKWYVNNQEQPTINLFD